jgi:Tfp pilus assembly protein PilF
LTAARNELEQAVRLDDSKSEYHYQLAQVYRRLGDAARAGAEMARFRAMSQRQQSTGDTSDFNQP